jgi:hypothetical protein
MSLKFKIYKLYFLIYRKLLTRYTFYVLMGGGGRFSECDTVYYYSRIPTFRRNVLPPSSGLKRSVFVQPRTTLDLKFSHR